MERGRQDLHLAGGEHLLEAREQAARGEVGHDARPAAGRARARGIPVARASHASQVRTVSAASTVRMPIAVPMHVAVRGCPPALRSMRLLGEIVDDRR